MKNIFRALCAVGMAGAMILGSASVNALPDDASDTDNQTVYNQNVSDEFDVALQNSNYTLYHNPKTNEIALESRQNGSVLYSNPQDRATDSIADAEKKNNLSSQIIVYYYKEQVLSEMNSYYYATSLKQCKVKTDGEKFRVKYNLGQQKFTIDQLPQVLSRERMEKEILPKIGKEDRAEVLKRYILYSRKELSKEAFAAVKNSFPIIEEHDIYIRAQMPDYEGEEIWLILEKAGYSIEDLKRDCAENKVENTYEEQASFSVELVYTLNDDGFSVTCDPEKIGYVDNFKPVRIEILPFLGAAGMSDAGYMFVPDGSGAIIRYNNGKKKSNEYWQSLFGDDSAISKSEGSAERQQSLLPVFATCSTNGGFLATIDSGYENAGIAADISGKVNSYNYVRPFFDVFAADVLSIGQSSANNTFLSTAKKCFSREFKVSYRPVAKDTTYTDLAVMYRDYLLETKQLKETKTDDTALNLEFIGTVGVKKKFFGFPYDSLESVTTFEQALDIVNELGIKDVDIKYTAALKGGLKQSDASSVEPIKMLGSKKDLKELQNTVGQVYFSYYATQQANAPKSQTARTLGGQLVKRYEYDLVSRQIQKKKYMVQLSTKTLIKNSDKILKTAKKSNVQAVNLLDIGFELNSDFSKSNTIDTAKARQNIQKYLQKLSGDINVSVEHGGVYALAYADKIWNIPTSDSGYNIIDQSVPFYAIVVRGSIPIVTSPVNTSPDPVKQFLQTVEIGAQLQYSWLYEYAENLIDRKESYYDRDYKDTVKQAAQYAEKIGKLYDAIGHSKITAHTGISDTLTSVTYDNGVTVVVNYDTVDAAFGETQISAQDFVILR